MSQLFEKDPTHWLKKYTPREWIQIAMSEVSRAEQAYAQRDRKAGIASCKRAAGMGLNAALLCEPNSAWGRTFVEHLAGLERDPSVPAQIKEACALLMRTHVPGGDVVVLFTQKSDERMLEAARDVIAHAYTIMVRYEAKTLS